MSAGRPRLRPDVVIVEQTFRGEQSFVVKDPTTKKYYRMRPAEARVLRAFDGVRSGADVVDALGAQGLRLTSAAVESFARTCARLGLLERTLVERTTLQLERLRAERRRRRSLFRGELTRMRWSVGDPNRLFDRLMPSLRWCFTRGFVVASVLLFATYAAVVVGSWSEFTRGVAHLTALSSLTASRIALLSLVTLVVIGLHELGHGFVCKHFGGDVHELGFMLIYFQPAFYCNVNDAWSFPELRARLWVTAAGSWVQMVIASLAAVVWWLARPDTLLSDTALAAMLIGGITTVVTNANPLIPLDGYFALSDWLEVPNLRQRALAHVGWWVRRRALRLDLPEPPASERERRIFLIYGSLAALYIGTVLWFTARLLLRWGGRALGALGVLLVAAFLATLMRGTLREWARAATLSVRSHRARWRADPARWRRARRAGWALLAIVVLAAVVPWPIAASGAFRATSARETAVIAPEPGVVTEVLVREGERVAVGTPLLRLANPEAARTLEGRVRDVDSLATRATGALAAGDAGAAAWYAASGSAAEERAGALRRRVDALTLRALADGDVVTERPEALLGRRLAAGDAPLALGDPDSVEVRIALTGAGAALARPGQEAHLVSYADVAEPVVARVASVSSAGPAAGGRAGGVEARVRLARTAAWRPGVTGEARIALARSTVLGALWWAVRARLRPEVLL